MLSNTFPILPAVNELMNLAHLVGLHIPGADQHALRVATLAAELAIAMGIPRDEVAYIQAAGLLHDVGKLNISAGIFAKATFLSDEEWVIIKRHTVYGRAILAQHGSMHPLLDTVHFHHEWWDGSGYPLGLRKTEIPLAARILAVVDVWDALLEDRPYKSAWTRDQARQHLLYQADKHFDPMVVLEFLGLQNAMVSY